MNHQLRRLLVLTAGIVNEVQIELVVARPWESALDRLEQECASGRPETCEIQAHLMAVWTRLQAALVRIADARGDAIVSTLAEANTDWAALDVSKGQVALRALGASATPARDCQR